jgi:phage shock protein PspC (stress-responsive transcriptional regulator)
MAWAQQSAGQAPPGETRGGSGTREAHVASEPDRHRLRRYPDRGLLGGVGAGIAEHLGVNVLIVRVLMAIVMTAGGVGVVLYALGWALIPVAPESEGVPRRRGAWREAVLMVLIAAVALYGLRRVGLLIGDAFIWPLAIGTCGMALVWRPAAAGRPEPMRWPPSPRELWRRLGQIDLPRVVIGGLLVAFAAAALLHAAGVLHSLGMALGAVAIVATMLGLLLGPWAVTLGRSLAFERAARIREQERAEMAAHLHDSVLQTLALIQKRAGDPREVAGLARRQERELRHWLQARPAICGDDSVAEALERAAAEVEELHRVPIEVVTVGDRPIDGELEAMVQAAREAMTNAAKFAQTERVDLYVEVEPERVEVYVRDRGVGFDPEAIPSDRRGVRDSIIARMERHHGRAAVHSVPGEGTEVELVMERRPL